MSYLELERSSWVLQVDPRTSRAKAGRSQETDKAQRGGVMRLEKD